MRPANTGDRDPPEITVREHSSDTARLDLLHDALLWIAGCPNVDTLHSQLHLHLCSLFDFDLCGLTLRTETGHSKFHLSTDNGEQTDTSKESQLGEMAMDSGLLQESCEADPAAALLACPLCVNERTIGALVVSSSKKSAFNLSDFTFLESVSSHLAVAVDRLRQIDRLDRANRALDASNLELQQFAYVASHDLKAPLRSVSGFLQLLSSRYRGQLDEQADEWIDRSVDSAEHMKTLIEALISYSRVDSRARPFTEIAFASVLDNALAMLDASIRDSNATITTGTLPIVNGDETQLVQLMQNLIGNAIIYQSDQAPRIHVSAEDCGLDWKFSVRDNGIGISAKHHQRIFEVFRRLHTQEAYPGTGIGLAICRRVIQRHSGSLSVESEGVAGKGTTFIFTLPKSTATQ